MKGHVDGHVDSSDVVTGIGPVFALELRTVMCTRIVAMIVDQDAVSRATERIMQPTPKVRRSRLTDGSVVQPAATMAATATKLNADTDWPPVPACGSRSHERAVTAHQVMKLPSL